MRLRPQSAEMIEGETNRLVFNLSPAVGANTIQGTPTVECSSLTFTGTAATGASVTTFVSGGVRDTDYIVKITATLSSGETKVGAVTLQFKEAGHDARTAC